MTDINIGAITEALNDKTDRDMRNVDNTAGADAIVDYQTPTAQNDYTWYRKYKSGWVEQGGFVTGNSSYNKRTITLLIAMADTNYHTSCTIRWGNGSNWYTAQGTVNQAALTDIAGPVADMTTVSFSLQSFSYQAWRVEGMAAS